MKKINCEICGLVISEPEDGVLVIDEKKWFEYLDGIGARKKEHENTPVHLRRNLSDVFGQKALHWEWVHKGCEDKLEREEDGKRILYSIDGETIQTKEDAFSWTLHLLKKNWFGWTDWGKVIQRLFGQIERPIRG